MGDSILLSETSEEWGKKRKSLSVAFYKEKLMLMCDIVKQCMAEKVAEIKEKYVKPKKEMDLIHEISKTFIKIILTCAFGEDLSDTELDYCENGEIKKKTVAFVLRETFH